MHTKSFLRINILQIMTTSPDLGKTVTVTMLSHCGTIHFRCATGGLEMNLVSIINYISLSFRNELTLFYPSFSWVHHMGQFVIL